MNGSRLCLLANADLQWLFHPATCSLLVLFRISIPPTCSFFFRRAICLLLVLFRISILHVSIDNIFLALKSLSLTAFAYTKVLQFSGHVGVQCLQLLRLTSPALVRYYQLS